MKLPTRDQLVKRRDTTLADAQSKLDAEDFHGCADAMMDLREIDAALNLLRHGSPEIAEYCENGVHKIRWSVTQDDFQCDHCKLWFSPSRRNT